MNDEMVKQVPEQLPSKFSVSFLLGPSQPWAVEVNSLREATSEEGVQAALNDLIAEAKLGDSVSYKDTHKSGGPWDERLQSQQKVDGSFLWRPVGQEGQCLSTVVRVACRCALHRRGGLLC